MPQSLHGQRGRYRLDLTCVRSGGQASVFRAQAPDGALVAIKIARDHGSNPGLERERDALATLQESDRWVLRLLDHGLSPEGLVFLVLPWCERNLRDWLIQADPPLPDRLLALEQVCEAVHRLHHSADELTTLRLHRDIKPENLLLAEEGSPGEGAGWRVILADLGGMKEGHLLDRSVQTGLYTPDFAPPEQLLPLERLPDPSLDIHALGATVYFVLTGSAPRAVCRRQAALTPAAERLLALHRRQQLDAAEMAELTRLRSAPVGALVDLDAQPPLAREDEALMLNRLREQLEGRVQGPLELARRLVTELLPPLSDALKPDPERRAQTARPLLAACRRCRSLLAEAGLDPEPATRDERSSAAPSTTAPVQAAALPRRRSWLFATLALAGLLALVALGVGQIDPPRPVPSVLPPPAAAAVEAPATEARPSRASESTQAPAPPLEAAPPAPADSPVATVEKGTGGLKASKPPPAPPVAAPAEPPRLLVRLARDAAPRIEHDGKVHLNSTTLRLSPGRSRIRVTDSLDPGFPGCDWPVEVRPVDEQSWSVSVGRQDIRLGPGEKGRALCTGTGSLELSRP